MKLAYKDDKIIWDNMIYKEDNNNVQIFFLKIIYRVTGGSWKSGCIRTSWAWQGVSFAYG